VKRPTVIAGEVVSRRLAVALTKVARAAQLVDTTADEEDWSVLTPEVLQAMPARIGIANIYRLRGIGPLLLTEIEAFMQRAGHPLPPIVRGYRFGGPHYGSYFFGPPSQHGYYWWRPGDRDAPTIRHVTPESDPASLVQGQWAGPLQPPMH
jgi:hypothetical protein